MSGRVRGPRLWSASSAAGHHGPSPHLSTSPPTLQVIGSTPTINEDAHIADTCTSPPLLHANDSSRFAPTITPREPTALPAAVSTPPTTPTAKHTDGRDPAATRALRAKFEVAVVERAEARERADRLAAENASLTHTLAEVASATNATARASLQMLQRLADMCAPKSNDHSTSHASKQEEVRCFQELATSAELLRVTASDALSCLTKQNEGTTESATVRGLANVASRLPKPDDSGLPTEGACIARYREALSRHAASASSPQKKQQAVAIVPRADSVESTDRHTVMGMLGTAVASLNREFTELCFGRRDVAGRGAGDDAPLPAESELLQKWPSVNVHEDPHHVAELRRHRRVVVPLLEVPRGWCRCLVNAPDGARQAALSASPQSSAHDRNAEFGSVLRSLMAVCPWSAPLILSCMTALELLPSASSSSSPRAMATALPFSLTPDESHEGRQFAKALRSVLRRSVTAHGASRFGLNMGMPSPTSDPLVPAIMRLFRDCSSADLTTTVLCANQGRDRVSFHWRGLLHLARVVDAQHDLGQAHTASTEVVDPASEAASEAQQHHSEQLRRLLTELQTVLSSAETPVALIDAQWLDAAGGPGAVSRFLAAVVRQQLHLSQKPLLHRERAEASPAQCHQQPHTSAVQNNGQRRILPPPRAASTPPLAPQRALGNQLAPLMASPGSDSPTSLNSGALALATGVRGITAARRERSMPQRAATPGTVSSTRPATGSSIMSMARPQSREVKLKPSPTPDPVDEVSPATGW